MPEDNLRFTGLCKVIHESAMYIALVINKENIELSYEQRVQLGAGIALVEDDMKHSADIICASPKLLKNREHIIVSLMLIAEKMRYVDDSAFVNSFHIACLDLIQRIRDKNYT